METPTGVNPRNRQSGFALILAMLTLLLLTFLGLALATSTSTELRIATNYRWSQQALYNAEAGIEMGKALLRQMNWTLIMPPARRAPTGGNSGCTNTQGLLCWQYGTAPSVPTSAPYSRNDGTGRTARNYEGGPCDKFGHGVGYGVVLDDGGGFGPYQNVTSISGQSVNGTFTLWVRRDVVLNTDASYSDETGTTATSADDRLILTAEGTAPYTAAQQNARTEANRAVRLLEVTVTRTLSPPCGTRGGQIGGGPEGSNFSPCDPITGDSLVTALGGPRTESSAQ